ncbi:crotonobetainyl-CoA:carnitine CoA-transferase CaiB-like acyl-CoA transferase [Antricoccus suffuscus]|uniref:Crotonobetainyl-CoA:carnitine CoA-transferase CaiB-like acyl-CoA transferase n=1 Tax=Antricoccus suffuscus TaxID=1629062 RepID=A0A2T0ZWW4_9ACTN|nr:CoA transferase [Antricoccus suffuscus]PRZ40855.1 crotonobetainyl-CoA:carnitine CoA-transferase CaiB-like acyl-CoA transferase [Antricoccus suffuscus]
MLEGITVLEVGDEPAVRFCGWIFAMNGAAVTRLGQRTPSGRTDKWSDAYLNTHKVVQDSETLSKTGFQEMVAGADVVIGDSNIDWTLYAAVSAVTGTVDAFATDGPYAGWRGTELVYATLGGATGYTFTRDDEPVYGYGDRFQYLAGMYLYQSLCSCLLQADLNGPLEESYTTPRVRVSNFESVVSLLPYLTTQYEYNKVESTKEQSGPRFVSRCTDGFIVSYAGFAWEPIAKTLDRLDLLEDPRFVDNSARFENMATLGIVLDEWASNKTVAEACRAGAQYNVAITDIRSPEAALGDESLSQRGAWCDVEMDGRQGRVPAAPYTVDGGRPHISASEVVA